MSNYLIGALLALGAGIFFNTGFIFQKKAILLTQSNGNKLGALIKTPLWLLGVGIQFLIGVPLNALAQLFIGPGLIPGIMAFGMVVLALGSNIYLKERLTRTEISGICLVVAAVLCLSLSGLEVPLSGTSLLEPRFIFRLALETACIVMAALVFLLLAHRAKKNNGLYSILLSGILSALMNISLAIFMGLTPLLLSGSIRFKEGLLLAAAFSATLLSGGFSVFYSQKAFSLGRVSILVPVQQVPIQLVPLLTAMYVFAVFPKTASSAVFLAAGALLILLSSFLLSKKQG